MDEFDIHHVDCTWVGHVVCGVAQRPCKRARQFLSHRNWRSALVGTLHGRQVVSEAQLALWCRSGSDLLSPQLAADSFTGWSAHPQEEAEFFDIESFTGPQEFWDKIGS